MAPWSRLRLQHIPHNEKKMNRMKQIAIGTKISMLIGGALRNVAVTSY